MRSETEAAPTAGAVQPPATAKTRSFAAHAGNYAWAELIGTAVGLLSFPILTRLLSVSDYGTMNLVASVIGLTVALGKFGIQHAALRMWAEVRAGHSPYAAPAFEATVLWGMVVTGSVVTVLWVLAMWLLPEATWAGPDVVQAMLLSAPLILLRVLDSGLSNQLRAQELTAELAIYGTVRRVGTLVAVVAVLLWLSRDLRGLYLATVAFEIAVVLGLMAWMFRGRSWPVPRQFSMPLWGSLAGFGLPMLGSELATVILSMGDRFIIQTQLGTEPLGIYAATYNVCDHLRNALLGAMVGAAYPRCMALWAQEGAEGLRRFLVQFMHYYAIAAVYLVALMSMAGGQLMVVLATERYAAGAGLAGWIMAGLAIQAVGTVAAVGIFLAKRTVLAMSLMLAGGALNIGANLLLLPRVGLQGAAWAVLGASLAICVGQLLVARRFAPVVVPWKALSRYGLVAAASVAIASQVHGHAAWSDLLLKVLVLTTLYLGACFALESGLRQKAFSALQKLGR